MASGHRVTPTIGVFVAMLAVYLGISLSDRPSAFFLHVGSWAASVLHLDRRPFSAQAWQDEAQMRDQVRLKMVDNLLKTHKIKDATRREVEALLGPPQPDESRYAKHADLVYWLGWERALLFSHDHEWLLIHLNDESKVSYVEMKTLPSR